MNKVQKAAEFAKALVGCPYIFGAYGKKCTVEYRKSVIETREEYAVKITNNCPVLSGKQRTCSGCKYEGKQSFDCRGLTWYVCDKAGLKISKVGATTQWNTDSWQEKGTINKAPLDKEFVVFRQDDQGIMQHTGFRLADGTVIDARGHSQGVISANENTYEWTHYAIPYGADDASKGCWRKGPGIDFFRTVESAIGKKDIIAEDLGFVTPDVAELLKETGYPGMKVLEMAFDKRDPQGSLYLPENYYENCVAYLGTHDNEPAIGWIMTADREDTAEAIRYLGLNDPDNYNWDMMRSIWKSDAGLTVVQAQDILGLGTESRMNTPSMPAGNWQWRSLPGSFNEELASKLADEMKACRRCK